MLSLIPANVSPYKFVYYTLRAGGLINQDGRPWSLIYSILHVILMTTFLTLAFLQVLLGNEELEKFILTLSSLVDFFQVYVKLFAMLAYENKVRILLKRLQKYRSLLLNDVKYKNKMIETDEICRKYAKYYSVIFFSYPIFSFINNFINDYSTNFQQPHLTHELYIPWNINEFWRYMAASLFVTLMTFSGIFIYIAAGVFQFTFSIQMSGFAKILIDRIETNGPSDKTIYEHHKMLKQFLQDYNDIFAGQQFVEIMAASLMPCGYGFTIIKGFKTNQPASTLVYYSLFLSLLGPFIICYCGQEISSHMERLHDSSYMSYWYEEKPKVRRDLFTMKLVAIKPMTQNYRMFITYNYECFTTIVQGIYSYIMMINNFSD